MSAAPRPTTMDAALVATLHACVPVFDAHCHAPWCLIGSAALAVSGLGGVAPADVDVLCDREDAERIRAAWAPHMVAAHMPADGDRFRSRFTRYAHLPLPVEVMGGLEVHDATGWVPLDVRGIRRVPVQGVAVPVPTLDEQARILARFGRGKDRARAALIAAFQSSRAHD